MKKIAILLALLTIGSTALIGGSVKASAKTIETASSNYVRVFTIVKSCVGDPVGGGVKHYFEKGDEVYFNCSLKDAYIIKYDGRLYYIPKDCARYKYVMQS